MIRVHLDEAPYERRLAHPRRSDDGHEGGRPLLDARRPSVVEGDILLLLGPVEIALDGPLRPDDVRDRVGPGVVAVLLRAGLGLALLLLLLPSAAAGFGRLVSAIDLIVGAARGGGGGGGG